MKRAIIIMTDDPRTGEQKSGLARIASPEQRSELAAVLLSDAVAKGRRVCEHVYVAFAPADAEKRIAEIAGPDARLIAQAGDGMGERINEAFASVFGDGFGEVLMIWTDSPSVPVDFFEQAFEWLELNSEVVLGPTEGGGFYLIGLRGMRDEVFASVDWGSGRAFETVFRNVSESGLHLREVPGWYGVKDPDDLAKLANEFLHNGNACRRAPETFKWLTENFTI